MESLSLELDDFLYEAYSVSKVTVFSISINDSSYRFIIWYFLICLRITELEGAVEIQPTYFTVEETEA